LFPETSENIHSCVELTALNRQLTSMSKRAYPDTVSVPSSSGLVGLCCKKRSLISLNYVDTEALRSEDVDLDSMGLPVVTVPIINAHDVLLGVMQMVPSARSPLLSDSRQSVNTYGNEEMTFQRAAEWFSHQVGQPLTYLLDNVGRKGRRPLSIPSSFCLAVEGDGVPAAEKTLHDKDIKEDVDPALSIDRSVDVAMLDSRLHSSIGVLKQALAQVPTTPTQTSMIIHFVQALVPESKLSTEKLLMIEDAGAKIIELAKISSQLVSGIQAQLRREKVCGPLCLEMVCDDCLLRLNSWKRSAAAPICMKLPQHTQEELQK
jgi:hypothetical protein